MTEYGGFMNHCPRENESTDAPHIVDVYEYGNNFFDAYKVSCSCGMSSSFQDNEKNAIKEWNLMTDELNHAKFLRDRQWTERD